MRATRAIATVAAAIALVATAAPAASASGPPPGRALAADFARVWDGLSLLGRPSSPLSRIGRVRVFELRLANQDGYRFVVIAYGQTVALSVSNALRSEGEEGAQRASSTVYVAHGTVTETRIAASFGARGGIDVRFRPSGRYLRATRRAGCGRATHRVLANLGLFVGRLRFKGENGFTSVRAHRVRGGRTSVKALALCSRGLEPLERRALLPRSEPSPLGAAAALSRAGEETEVAADPVVQPKPTTLAASVVAPLARLVFGARAGADGVPVFLAAEQSVEGRLGIVRLVSARGRAGSFAFDDALATATVTPPPPFRGEGVFEHGVGNAKSWSGSLAVTFLGAARVPLVGERFRPRLNRGW